MYKLDYKESKSFIKDMDLASWLLANMPDDWEFDRGCACCKSNKSLRVKQGLSVYRDFGTPHSPQPWGNGIDLLHYYYSKSVPEAIEMLTADTYSGSIAAATSGATVIRSKPTGPQWPQADSNNDAVIRYLTEVRGLPRAVVDLMLMNGSLYQDRHKNCVFRSVDGLYGEIRGTSSVPFKRSIAGSKTGGYWEIWSGLPLTECFICESAIEAASLCALRAAAGLPAAVYCSVGGVSKTTAAKAIIEAAQQTGIPVTIAYNNDDPGVQAAEKLQAKHPECKKIFPPRSCGKDWNDYLRSKQSTHN